MNWEWHFGNGDISNIQNPSYSFDSLGSYDIKLIVESSGGCVDSFEQLNLIQITGPYAELGVNPNQGCSYTNFNFNIIVDSNLNNYYWTFGDGNTANGPNASHVYNTSGTFKVSLIIDDPNCNYTIDLDDSIYVEYLEADFFIDIDSGCVPHAIQTTTSSTNAQSYNWSFGDGGSFNGNNPSYTYNTAGNYECELVITSPIGCLDTIKQSITVHELPIVQLSNDTSICDQQEAYLKNTGNYQCQWAPIQFLNNPNDCYPTATPDSSKYFYITITDENNCQNQDSVFVEVFQVNPTIVDITPDTSIAIGEQLQLWTNTSGTKSFEWDPGDDLNCSNCADPIFNGTESQNYTVSIIDSNQCLESQEYVFIEVRDEFTVNLPQAFSPNGDGISDIIKVKGWGIKELLDFKVYNRWGELIYHGQDINNGWNGEYKGEKQMSGTYVYVISVKNYKDETYTTKGNFLLLR